LCRGQGKRTMREPEVQIGNSGFQEYSSVVSDRMP
jgi:hypothetical protein